MRTLIRLLKDTRGLTTIEYGLIAVLIAVSLVLTLGVLGEQLNETYQDLNQQLQSHL